MGIRDGDLGTLLFLTLTSQDTALSMPRLIQQVNERTATGSPYRYTKFDRLWAILDTKL